VKRFEAEKRGEERGKKTQRIGLKNVGVKQELQMNFIWCNSTGDQLLHNKNIVAAGMSNRLY
jgi:hypothetical protein